MQLLFGCFSYMDTLIWGVVEVVPCSSKIRDWPLDLSQDRFGLHKVKKNVKSDHGTWGLQKACFQAYISHFHGRTCNALGEAKEVLSLQMARGPW